MCIYIKMSHHDSFTTILIKKIIEVFWSLSLIWLISNRLYETDCELNHAERARTPLTRSAGYEEYAC